MVLWSVGCGWKSCDAFWWASRKECYFCNLVVCGWVLPNLILILDQGNILISRSPHYSSLNVSDTANVSDISQCNWTYLIYLNVSVHISGRDVVHKKRKVSDNRFTSQRGHSLLHCITGLHTCNLTKSFQPNKDIRNKMRKKMQKTAPNLKKKNVSKKSRELCEISDQLFAWTLLKKHLLLGFTPGIIKMWPLLQA